MIEILLKIKPSLEMGYKLSFIEAELLKRAIDQLSVSKPFMVNLPPLPDQVVSDIPFTPMNVMQAVRNMDIEAIEAAGGSVKDA
nr:hypothetical protein [Pantoea sp. 201603H]